LQGPLLLTYRGRKPEGVPINASASQVGHEAQTPVQRQLQVCEVSGSQSSLDRFPAKKIVINTRHNGCVNNFYNFASLIALPTIAEISSVYTGSKRVEQAYVLPLRESVV
jgi:hypothetical protein